MVEESKLEDKSADKEAAEELIADSQDPTANDEVESEEEEDDHEEPGPSTEGAASSASAKKKKSKKKRIKSALTGVLKKDKQPTEEDVHKAVNGLSNEQVSQLLAMNPSLARELGVEPGTSVEHAAEALKKLNLQDIMTGLAASGKNVKDMGSYKFWQTQPVPRLDERPEHVEEGPIKIIDLERVPKEPPPIMEGFEWVTLDITKEEDLNDLFELLNNHYVEDEESMFRFSYSKAFFQWALMSPGWRKEWHVGVRASKSQKLVAFISGVPVDLRVRGKVVRATEINFLNVHKKLRSKRLAPVLIKEITRRCYVNEIYQAIYTAGVVLPTPVSTCRYFHRSLDWQKLYDVGFSPLPPNSKPSYQVAKFRLPDHTETKGLRPMETKDIDVVLDLLRRYLARFQMAPIFTREEVEHWLIPKVGASNPEQVIFSYVVEDPTTKKVTDFISFYSLASTVIGHPRHEKVNAAYLYYYATETVFQAPNDKAALKTRLNSLVHDALILAKRNKFDVFNALTLMDNGLFLEQQKFGKGDGQLHFYLYNYRANPIAGGVDKKNEVDEANLSGIGVVML